MKRWIVGALLALAGCATVTREEAHRLVAGGARLVDVRSPGEFAGGHIDGAINVPVGEIEKRLGEIGPTDRPVVLYCAHGIRAARAARLLAHAGYTSVHNLGAMHNW